MRRLAATGFAFVLSAFTVLAMAQTGGKKDAKGKGADAGASTTAATSAAKGDAGAAASGATMASSTGASGGGDAGIASGASAPAVMPAASGSAGMDGQTYAVRLRDLEARVDELKDQIRRSHTRLALLSDTIMSGGAAGSRSEIVFHNEMSSAFKLVRALIVLDGAIQYNRQDDTGALADQKEIPVFTGSIPPGDHTVSVVLTFQGNGYGVFTYLRGYKFEEKGSHSFTAVEGKTITVGVTAFEKGGVTTPLEQRPKLEFNEKVQALGAGAAAIPASQGGAGAAKASGSTTSTPSGGAASGGFQIGGGTK